MAAETEPCPAAIVVDDLSFTLAPGCPEILKGVSEDGEDVLIIDDLVDTGATARVVRAMLPKAHYAAVYAKPEGRPLVDTFVTEVSQDTWIFLPWDTELQFVQPIANAGKSG